MKNIMFFSPLLWSEIQKNGFRKTSSSMFKEFWQRDDIEKIFFVQFENRYGWKENVIQINRKVLIIGLPIGLPFERFSWIRRTNKYLQSHLLKKFIKSIFLIYWFYDWWNIELISLLPGNCTVMEITDNVNHFISTDKFSQKHLDYVMNLTFDRVDHIFVVSEAIIPKTEGYHGTCTVLPNSIMQDFLDIAREPQTEPVELIGLSHPRLCLVCANWPLNYRIDHELLLNTLDLLPEWNLVIIGFEKCESKGLHNLLMHPRVTVLGLLPLLNLPGYIQHCDICIVPYKKNAQNFGDRLKIYEYLACRKPVILSVDEGRDELRPYLKYAFSPEQFANACKEIITAEKPNYTEINSLLNNMTSKKRAEKCLSIINL